MGQAMTLHLYIILSLVIFTLATLTVATFIQE